MIKRDNEYRNWANYSLISHWSKTEISAKLITLEKGLKLHVVSDKNSLN